MGKNNRSKNIIKSNNKTETSYNSFANLNIENEENEQLEDQIEKISELKNTYVVDGREENEEDEWTPVEKKTKKKYTRVFTKPDHRPEHIFTKSNNVYEEHDNEIDTEECLDDGSQYKFNMKWYIWTHLSESSDWSPDSYKHIYTIESMKDFWEFFGNLDKLDILKHQFYIMRETSGPTWEHPSNRGGGICSLRLQKDKLVELSEQIAIFIINECLLEDNTEINGFSISAKHSWGVIKIWNKSSKNDISSKLPQYMIRKYSLSPRYGSNKPEY